MSKIEEAKDFISAVSDFEAVSVLIKRAPEAVYRDLFEDIACYCADVFRGAESHLDGVFYRRVLNASHGVRFVEIREAVAGMSSNFYIGSRHIVAKIFRRWAMLNEVYDFCDMPSSKIYFHCDMGNKLVDFINEIIASRSYSEMSSDLVEVLSSANLELIISQPEAE